MVHAWQVFISKCLAMMSERLDMFKANEVAVALWAVARLRGQPDLHLMAAALQHCFTQVRVMPGLAVRPSCVVPGSSSLQIHDDCHRQMFCCMHLRLAEQCTARIPAAIAYAA